jgi:hypothetical protein
MAYINDTVFDSGLSYITTNANRVDICSTEPTTYTEAITTYTLGNETTITTTGPSDAGTGTGRRAIIDQITAGDVTGTGTATSWGVTYTTGTALLAAGSLSSSQAVTNGNTFTLDAIDIIIRDPT